MYLLSSYVDRWPRPSKTLPSVIIHRVGLLAPILLHLQRDKGLVRGQKRPGKRIAPVDAEAWACDLDPALDVAHEGQLSWEDLTQEQVDPGDASLRQLLLNEGHGVRVTLAAERAEDEPPFLGLLGRGDGGAAYRLHLVMLVRLAGEFAGVRVVAIRGDRGVVDHDALEVEAAVAEVQDEVDGVVVLKTRGGAPEDLALAERCDLGYDNAEARPLQSVLDTVDGGVELNGADHGDGLACGEVALEGGKEVSDVDADVDKDVESLDLCHVDGDETAVGVVDEEIASERPRCVVVDAAGAIGDIAHDECLDAWAKLHEDI